VSRQIAHLSLSIRTLTHLLTALADYNNTLSIALCLGGVAFGLLMRYTHRYKGACGHGAVSDFTVCGRLINLARQACNSPVSA
jgi:hypothetical protein